MQKDNLVRYTAMFIALVLLQVLVFNRISLFGYATPYLYIYFIIKLPVGIHRNITLILAFLIGFTIDIFANTPGVNAAATTLAAFVRRPIMSLLFTLDDYEEQMPRLPLLGWTFVKYVLAMVFIHHASLILLESFTLFNIEMQLMRIVFSFILTSLFIFGLEGFSVKRKNK